MSAKGKTQPSDAPDVNKQLSTDVKKAVTRIMAEPILPGWGSPASDLNGSFALEVAERQAHRDGVPYKSKEIADYPAMDYMLTQNIEERISEAIQHKQGPLPKDFVAAIHTLADGQTVEGVTLKAADVDNLLANLRVAELYKENMFAPEHRQAPLQQKRAEDNWFSTGSPLETESLSTLRLAIKQRVDQDIDNHISPPPATPATAKLETKDTPDLPDR